MKKFGTERPKSGQWRNFLFFKTLILAFTVQNFFLIWISRFFKKGASDNIISYFDQFFRFFGLWLILAIDLGRSGQNKSWETENRERTNDDFFFNFEQWGMNTKKITKIRNFETHYLNRFAPYKRDGLEHIEDVRVCHFLFMMRHFFSYFVVKKFHVNCL